MIENVKFNTGYLEVESGDDVIGFEDTTWEVEYEIGPVVVKGNHDHPREMPLPILTATYLLKVEGREPTSDERHLLRNFAVSDERLCQLAD